MRGFLESTPLGLSLAVLALVVAVGCGGGSSKVSPSSLEGGGIDLTGKTVSLKLEDGLQMEFRVSRMEYPYIWGDRSIGERMPPREMRIDLRTVKRLRVLEGA